MNEAPAVFRVDRLELAFAPKPWAFADERRAEIDAFFAALQRDKPALWNGRVLLLHRSAGGGRRVHAATYLETDYASFAAWRAWGRPPAGVRDCFGAAAIVAGDGAVLLGVMGAAHLQCRAASIFPAARPIPTTLWTARSISISACGASSRRKPGSTPADFAAEPGWTTVVDGTLIAQIKVLRAPRERRSLARAHARHLARERQPELADIRIVRGPADFDPAMPRFVTAFLAHGSVCRR